MPSFTTVMTRSRTFPCRIVDRAPGYRHDCGHTFTRGRIRSGVRDLMAKVPRGRSAVKDDAVPPG